MPAISVFYGILVQMYWNDHAPPHFHALYAEEEVLIDIRTLDVLQENSLGGLWHLFWNGRSSTVLN